MLIKRFLDAVPCIPASLRSRIALILLIFTLFLPNWVNAQCAPQADFDIDPIRCEVYFTSLYSGPGTVLSHLWEFYESPTATVPSTSTVANPVHTVLGNGQVKRAVHTIRILTTEGQIVTYVCTQEFTAECEDECEEFWYRYQVEGCTLTIFRSGAKIDFGDGTIIAPFTNPVVHVYAVPGNYRVVINDVIACSRIISIGACKSEECCSAEFTGNTFVDCGVLKLDITPACPGGMAMVLDPCLRVNGNLGSGPVQISNINTCDTKTIPVRYAYTCANGTMLQQTINVPVAVEGIFIGETEETHNLTEYECVLPGPEYSGTCPVYVSGIITVDKQFTFSGSRIYVEKGLSGFTIPTGLILTLDKETSVQGTCDYLWRGIYLQNGQISTNNATIEDALFAIRPFGGGITDIIQTVFNKNFIGVFAVDGPFFNQNCMRNQFTGGANLKMIGNLSALTTGILAPGVFGEDLVQVTYSSGKGFAGIYLRDIGQFSLHNSVLSVGDQNLFSGLSVGIEAQNTSLLVDRMARFSDIDQTFYVAHVSAAIRHRDAIGGNLRVTGNNGAILDYERCAYGIISVSNVASTGINITSNHMNLMQTGVLLLNNESGQFRGREAYQRIRGIYRNNITVNRNLYEADGTGAGILLYGYNPSAIGDLDIWENNVTHDHSNNDPLASTAGIYILGANISGSSQQVDIFRNRVVVQQGTTLLGNATPGVTGVSGIYVERPGVVRIRENAPEAYPGAGIYLQGGPTATGIYNGLANGNNIFCNTVQSSIAGGFGIIGRNSPNSVIVSNLTTGAGVGTAFYGNSNSTRFRCNTMQNNSIGMTYRNAAQTGAQVSPTQTAGNCWDGTVVGVTRDGSITPGLSPYHVRSSFPCEFPPNSPIDAAGWFNTTTTNNPADCIFTCSAWLGAQAPPAEVSDMDALVAQDALQYPTYDANRRWMNRAILYDKLLTHPALVSQHTAVQNFYTGYAGSSMAQLVALQRGIGALNQYSVAQNAALHTLRTEQEQLEESIMEKEGAFALNANSSALSEKAALSSTLLTKQAESALLAAQLRTQALNEAAALVNTLTAITPANTPEANLKTVMLADLQYAFTDMQAPASVLTALQNIGTQCHFEGGPAIHYAQNLYQRFTGVRLFEADCNGGKPGPSTEDRSGAFQAAAIVAPNPAGDYIEVAMDIAAFAEPVALTLSNSLGAVQLESRLSSNTTRIETAHLLPGVYFLRATHAGKTLFTKPVIIRR
jgi:hypothetical protein